MYVNGHKAVPQRVALIKMGHPQSRKTIQTDISASHSVIYKNIHPRSKKGDGNAFPLAKVLIRPREVQVLLETGKI